MERTRTRKGPHFGEGSRLLWLRLLKSDLSVRDAGELVGLGASQFHRVLYGDRCPNMSEAEKLRVTFRIPLKAWTEAPQDLFELPAARTSASRHVA